MRFKPSKYSQRANQLPCSSNNGSSVRANLMAAANKNRIKRKRREDKLSPHKFISLKTNSFTNLMFSTSYNHMSGLFFELKDTIPKIIQI